MLSEIKRSAGTSVPTGVVLTTSVGSQKLAPSSFGPGVVKLVAGDQPEEVTHLKSEVQELKQRIASMTKNIDDLTCMVKNISVKDEEAPTDLAAPGQKRKKIKAESDDAAILDWNAPTLEDQFPALLSEVALPDIAPSSEVLSTPTSLVNDDAFIDELFDAFANEDEGPLSMSSFEDVPLSNIKSNSNKPDPQLMKRIEDSLSTIPKDMHKMVADRLIDAIANTQPIAKTVDGLFPNEKASDETDNMVDDCNDEGSKDNAVSLPVAVATLRTILAEYGVSVECHHKCRDQEERLAKSLPVVPIHA